MQNQQHNEKRAAIEQGCLELIIGSMFSGKTTRLVQKILHARHDGMNILCITHKIDTRYGQGIICTHDNRQTNADFCVDKLMPLLSSDNALAAFQLCDVIAIEEGHFFEDLTEFVMQTVDHMKKHVIVAGLDGTYERRPFTQIANLVPLADHITRTHARCSACADGTPAIFSKRLKMPQTTSANNIQSDNTILVGGSDMYTPVCRKHFLEDT
jgi:thymidine kinase